MGIQNFPAALQPIIQQGFLEREFQEALRSAGSAIGPAPTARNSPSASARR